ncbi:MAG: excinuclease ABC subunit UvrC [Parachlamydiales bacterium]|nr:excinuclease ABC subunit UvrC [Parachlamydiales bacterium]
MIFDVKKLATYPQMPGVYIMKDKAGKVLYVGKATNLKNRIKQYFQGKDTRPTIGLLTNQISSIETIVVTNNKEALILENTLIKKYLPKYNILLKDDKTYISIMISTQHKWPMLKLVRLKKQPKDKNLYFGPYTNAKAARNVKDLLLKLFPLRQCSDSEIANRTRPCILYDIKKCLAPCVEKCTKNQYDDLVDKTVKFLKGKDNSILKDFEKKMKKASNEQKFELANDYLNLIKEIKHIIQTQFVDILSTQNTDVLGLFRSGTFTMIVKLIFQEGRLTFSEHFSFSDILSDDAEIIESFILQNYITLKLVPKEIIVPFDLEHTNNLEDVLSEKANKKIKITYPIKGKKLDLVNLANENAKSLFKREKDLKSLHEKQLLELEEVLSLNNFPKVIECFDTSNMSGTNPVAAKIGFTFGEKDTKRTKLFKINPEILGDVPAMKDVLYRHFSKLPEKDFPDLLILDGAKAQLNAAIEVFNKLNIASVDIISLTKEKALHTKGLTKEKVFIPHKKDPIIIDPKSPMLFMLQKIRDEAHRVAISFHKKRREKSTIKTSLIDIPGIGPKKTKELLKHFKSLKNLQNAKKEDFDELKTISKSDIEKIFDFFKK